MLTRKLSTETPELSSVAAECRRTGVRHRKWPSGIRDDGHGFL